MVALEGITELRGKIVVLEDIGNSKLRTILHSRLRGNKFNFWYSDSGYREYKEHSGPYQEESYKDTHTERHRDNHTEHHKDNHRDYSDHSDARLEEENYSHYSDHTDKGYSESVSYGYNEHTDYYG